MPVLGANFDRKVIVPTAPVALPVGQELELRVTPIESGPQDTLLKKPAKPSREMPHDPRAPTDSAAQHDHYLYGLPKRP